MTLTTSVLVAFRFLGETPKDNESNPTLPEKESYQGLIGGKTFDSVTGRLGRHQK